MIAAMSRKGAEISRLRSALVTILSVGCSLEAADFIKTVLAKDEFTDDHTQRYRTNEQGYLVRAFPHAD